MTSLLEVRGAAVTGRLQATSLSVPGGQLVALIGPNGSGKTSLLRACAAIDGHADAVMVAGEDLRTAAAARRPRLMGYLPASRELVWPILVRDVIALGLSVPEPERVDEMLGLLELRPIANRPADRLSTGERARVLLARALAPRPKALLLDEPMSNLDPHWVLRLLELLRDLADQGAAVLVALHDIDKLRPFDRVLLVREGQVRADLAPSAMLASPLLAETFQVRHGHDGWQLSRSADPRSSP